MPRLLYVLVLALTLVAFPSVAQPPQDEDAKMSAIRESAVRGSWDAWRALMIMAEQGNAHAQFALGVLFHKNIQEGPEYTEAAQWYRQAAEQGHAEAQFTLGLLYADGDGVPQNDAEALTWFHRAAE